MTSTDGKHLIQIRPGDTWEYEVTGRSKNGPFRGTSISSMRLDSMHDYHGNPCWMLCDTYMVNGAFRGGVLYVSQDSDGTVFCHGSFYPPDRCRLIAKPESGCYPLIPSPMRIGNSYAQATEYEDGTSGRIDLRVEAEEDIRVPAGEFSTCRMAGAIVQADYTLALTYWCAPEIVWPVRVTRDYGSLVVTRELIAFKRLVPIVPRDMGMDDDTDR